MGVPFYSGFCINEWPFPKGEPITLHWLRSPRVEGDGKHWTVDAVFKTAGGALKDVSLPWGIIPVLRLGMVFIDGEPVSFHSSQAEERTLIFSKQAVIKIQKAINSISPATYPLKSRQNLEELCAVIFDQGQVIVIPCLEVMRCFFTVNKVMAHRLLRPFGFGDFVLGEKDGPKISLEFTKRLPRKIFNDFLRRTIALIMFEPIWTQAWSNVYMVREAEIISKQLEPKSAIPLNCIPPVLKDSIWNVKAVQDGKRVLVLEILGYKGHMKNSFNEVSYSEPQPQIPNRAHYRSKRKLSAYLPATRIKRSRSKPTNIGNPVLINNQTTLQEFDIPIRVKKALNKLGVSGIKRVGLGGEMDSNNKEGLVSLSEESGKGSTQAAEFLPITSSFNIPDGLKRFFRAIEAMKKIDRSLKISFSIHEVPLDSSLAFCGSERRRYAWVKVTCRNSEVSVLEFDLSDEHGISTILFSPIATNIRETLVSKYIIGNGNWDKRKILKLQGINVDWAVHRSTQPHIWASRVYNKIKMMGEK